MRLKMKVLMADDEAAIRSLFRHFLDKYPSPYITYEIFSTGDELRQACLKNAPNVVFTDIKMPGTSGLEAIYEIKQATADNATGYYVISGYTDFDYALQSLRLGIKDYLLKPMKYSQIESILRKEEENIFMGITLEDAWKLNNESLARKLSDCVQNLALAYQIRDRSYQKVLQNWAFIASGIPIDKTYFKEKFGTAIEDFSAQKTFFENASESESEEKYSRQIVKKVVEIIENNYQNAALGMDSIADKLGYSTQYLSMAFSKEEGMHFSAYLTKVRINNAIHLLENTKMRVKDIAEACGYSYSSYFIKVFRKQTGHSPEEFRIKSDSRK